MIPLGHGARILVTVLRYRLDTIIAEIAENHWSRWFLPSMYLPRPKTSSAVRLRKALESRGPIFIKFGQALSTRRDLLPADYADELARLQNKVPPFDSSVAVARIEESLGVSIEAAFESFEMDPIASASLAQVHRARLSDGTSVVVKVIRPDIEKGIRKDLRLMYSAAGFLERISRDARRLHLKDVVSDYEETIFAELDLLLEAENTATLRRNFAFSPLLYAPRVYFDLSSKDVLVMEEIDGVLIAEVDRLRELGTNMKLLAERGVETFFTQVFEHNFFHADMHPGNIFVDVSDPTDPSYIAIDCAIIGQLSPSDQRYLAQNILAFFNKDYHEIARLHLESGWIPHDTDIAEFENVIRELLDPMFQKPLSEILFGHFLLALFDTARQFDMEVQPQLVLLQKTLLNIEGLGRQLDPELDLWATAKPFLERWMAERYGPSAIMREFVEHAPRILVQLPKLPSLLASAGSKIADFELSMRQQKHQIQEIQATLQQERRTARRRQILGSAMIVVGLGLLWQTLTDALFQSQDTFTVAAGVAVALVGTVLVGRS